MSAPDVVATLRRGYELFERGDLAAILDIVDPEIEWSEDEGAPEGGTTSRGRDSFLRYIESWRETFPGLRLELRETLVAGDEVVVVLEQSGRGRASGIELSARPVHVWTVRDGRAVRWRSFPSRERALAAVAGTG